MRLPYVTLCTCAVTTTERSGSTWQLAGHEPDRKARGAGDAPRSLTMSAVDAGPRRCQGRRPCVLWRVRRGEGVEDAREGRAGEVPRTGRRLAAPECHQAEARHGFDRGRQWF